MDLPDVGDIQDLEIDTRTDPERLDIVSLWFSDKVSELDAETWNVLRQTRIGGVNYETAIAPADKALFAGRFYESRVVKIDLETFRKSGVFRTGLGTRALAVDEIRNLLLAASIYDGNCASTILNPKRLKASFRSVATSRVSPTTRLPAPRISAVNAASSGSMC
ncbi:MAG: hypothetical protein M5R36_04370 [Deltaproteobacteria bacterium]|nr:hypothetical protein [Deltaproteobacteria bacterium]